MKDFLQTAAFIIAGVLIIVALMFGGNLLNLWSLSFFGPKYQQVNREIFEGGKAYRDGVAQELRSLQLEYSKADANLKPAIAMAARHKAAGVPEDALPADLAMWLRSLP